MGVGGALPGQAKSQERQRVPACSDRRISRRAGNLCGDFRDQHGEDSPFISRRTVARRERCPYICCPVFVLPRLLFQSPPTFKLRPAPLRWPCPLPRARERPLILHLQVPPPSQDETVQSNRLPSPTPKRCRPHRFAGTHVFSSSCTPGLRKHPFRDKHDNNWRPVLQCWCASYLF